MISIKRTPGGYVKTRNLSGSFQDAVQRTYGVGNKKSPLTASKTIDRHTWGKAGGSSGMYKLEHTEINPYKAGALSAGVLAGSYGAYRGAKYIHNNPEKTKNSVGKLYAKHPTAMKRAHYTTAGITGVFAPNQKSLFGGVAANTGAFAYGLHQAENYNQSKR